MTTDRRQLTVTGNEKIYSFSSLGLIVWESSAGVWREGRYPQFFWRTSLKWLFGRLMKMWKENIN